MKEAVSGVRDDPALGSRPGICFEENNDLLPMYNITHSMSRAGTPTDNAAMEAINGWIKAELFKDFHMDESKTTEENIASCIRLSTTNARLTH